MSVQGDWDLTLADTRVNKGAGALQHDTVSE